MVLNTGQQ